MKLRISDRSLFSGEISSILSGELAYKIYTTVLKPEWSLESEFMNPLLNFAPSNVDQLVIDSLLLLGGWIAANIYQQQGALGNMPYRSKDALDQSLGLCVASANICLLIILCATLIARDGVKIEVMQYESMIATSLMACLAFRVYYARVRLST